jgi:exosortase/archaeosortase
MLYSVLKPTTFNGSPTYTNMVYSKISVIIFLYMSYLMTLAVSRLYSVSVLRNMTVYNFIYFVSSVIDLQELIYIQFSPL